MRKLLFVVSFFVLFLCACGGQNSGNEEILDQGQIEQLFSNFPESPFLDLKFNDEIIVVSTKLKNSGFIESKKQRLDWNKEDVRLLLTDTDKLTNFRIVFFNKNEEFYRKTSNYLSEKADKHQKSDENDSFEYFEFDSKTARFSLNMFFSEGNVRLHFKPSSWH